MSTLLKYDVIYILDPMAAEADTNAVSTKVEQVVAEAKGTVLKKDDWGKRRLAYAVRKHREGHYVFFHLSIPPTAVAEIQRNLRLMEKVIKFSVVKDTISHLKAKVKPPRVKAPGASTPTSRTGHRPPAAAPATPPTIPTPSTPAAESGESKPASAPTTA